MSKFNLSCAVTISAYTEVEADSLEEAIRLSEERDCVIGGYNSGNMADESWIVEEIDGMPDGIHES